MKVSKGMYLGLMAAGMVGGIVLVFIGMAAAIGGAMSVQQGGSQSGAQAAAAGGMGIAMLGYACFLVAGIVNLVLLYKAWSAINDGQARSTPGKAVGFLFIPIFNLYWMFQAIWGWAQDYNKYTVRHNVNVPKMPEGLFMAQSICLICSIIPFLGVLAALGHLILVFVNASKICDGINALAGAQPMAMGATAQ
jgi:hypothetical protein